MLRLRMRGRLVVRTLLILLALVVLVLAAAVWAVHRSVPTLDGQARVPGLQAAVTVSRDEIGTAVVKGANRLDVARGLGFVHAQERFFEMDLTRRSAAGELSELFGPMALERDRKRRLHRMRAMLSERLKSLDANEQALLQAYADGVNAGLAQLGTKPWQYLMLRSEPRAWQPVDSLLVIGEMFWMLQGNSVDEGFERAQWRGCVGAEMASWLEPASGRWDAALDGSVITPAVTAPDASRLDLRGPQPAPATPPLPASTPLARADFLPDLAGADRHEPLLGSNSWAVSGAHSVDGDAMLANDMHLGLGVPAIWFRAQFEIGSGAAALRAEGVTLPGVPALVVGSNGQVAWGFTNSYGQWFEWIKVPAGVDAAHLRRVDETIAVKGAAPVTLPVTLFDGLPVAQAQGDERYALNWVADQGAAYNLALDDMLAVRDADAAARVAARSGIPEQNIVIADRRGSVAWTIAGAMFATEDPLESPESRFETGPRKAVRDAARAGAAGVPVRAPVIENPAGGLLWTANNRTYDPFGPQPGAGAPDGASAPPLAPHAWRDLHRVIGDGGVDLGARAQQIAARLAATPRFDEKSLGAIHVDDEALFLQPWAARLAAVAAARPDVSALLKSWNGRADADQAAYRLVRETRRRTLDALWKAWSAPLIDAGRCPKREYDWHARFEYPVADALDHKPPHLLPRGFASWDAFLLAQVDATVVDMTHDGTRALAQATWGEKNASRIGHPLARAVPMLSRWLDMPSVPQAGDANMPRVAAPSFGQSERLVVAPGHEERATLSMPGGQSGHPMSPYYGAGHADWVSGRPTPLMAGPAQHVLTLSP